MLRTGNLWDDFISHANLFSAFKKASRGTKGYAADAFFFNLEKEIICLQKELAGCSYEPAQYRYFTINDPKQRVISVAPFRDRVVHHAIINILEPVYEKRFIFDSYATRKNKGTHKAIARAQAFLRRNEWYLKSDIEKYFYSVAHNILLDIIGGKIKDKFLYRLVEKVIRNGGENGKGIPIGNLTSQFFANVYLDVFDHFLKDQLGIQYYLRYMDDFVLFADNKEELKARRCLIRDFLWDKLRLKIKEKADIINQRLHGLSFLGMRIFPHYLRIKRENLRRSLLRLERKEFQYKHQLIMEKEYVMSVQSVVSHLSWPGTYSFRKEYFYGQLSKNRLKPCSAGRQLEQQY